MAVTNLTQARLKQVLHYEPETGVFTWLQARKPFGGKSAGTTRNGDGYLRIAIDGRMYLGHRLAWLYMTGAWPPEDIDHRDLNRSNNRWENLRPASRTQNFANRRARPGSASGLKGVHRHDAKWWRARIYVNGRGYHLGLFADPDSAHAAYLAAAQQHFGEFARAG